MQLIGRRCVGLGMRILKIILLTMAGFIVALVLLLTFAGDLLRHPLEKVASKELQREVTLDKLSFHVLSLTPGATLEGLRVSNPAWVRGTTASGGAAGMADIGKLDVAVRLLPLLRGQLVLSELGVEDGNVGLLRELDGKANWTFGQAKTASSTTPLALPVIEHLYVKNSRLRVEDALTKMGFDGEFVTEEGGDSRQPFSLNGQGELNKQPFKLALTGGALSSALENQTYPFDLDVHHGATRITAKGTFNHPLSFGDFTAALTLSGKNLADLYYLTGLAFPITRDYSLKGDLSRAGDIYTLDRLAGKLGGSDLSGNLKVVVGGTKPMLMADLRSQVLDPADAGVIFGGDATSQYLLPDSPLDLVRLRSMNADVTYKAAAINVDKLPLKQVSVHMKLADGRLTLDPMALTLPQGTVSGSLVIDGSREVPELAADMKLSGARLEDFVAKAGQAGALEGPIVARVKLAGRGTSIHKAASVADGTAAIVVPNGTIRQAFAELMGVNAAKGLGLLLSGDKEGTPIRCGIASFEAKNGTLQAQHVVLDTGVVLATGGGTIRLDDETLDLTLKGKPKEVSLLHLMVPLKIQGKLKSPSLGVNPVPLGAQAGAAAALGVVLTPLAAVLPFVDVGLADDANCQGLMTDARQDAGVKAPKGTPAAPKR